MHAHKISTLVEKTAQRAQSLRQSPKELFNLYRGSVDGVAGKLAENEKPSPRFSQFKEMAAAFARPVVGEERELLLRRCETLFDALGKDVGARLIGGSFSTAIQAPVEELRKQLGIDFPAYVHCNPDFTGEAVAALRSSIGKDVALGPKTVLMPHARLDDRVCIGPESVIGPHSRMHTGVKAGSRLRFGEEAKAEAGVKFGDDVVIGAGTVLGPKVDVGSGTLIGEHSRIQTRWVGRGARIGRNVIADRFTGIEDEAVLPDGFTLLSGMVARKDGVLLDARLNRMAVE